MPNYKAHNTMTSKPLLERLWRRTIVDPNTGCWLWQGFCDKGHGYIRWNRWKAIGVHVASASIFMGHEPMENRKVQVNHRPGCLNRNCWNPEHLYIGNQYLNVLDRQATGTQNNPITSGIGNLK